VLERRIGGGISVLDVEDPATLGCGAELQSVGYEFNEVAARVLAQMGQDLAESEAIPKMRVFLAVGYRFQETAEEGEEGDFAPVVPDVPPRPPPTPGLGRGRIAEIDEEDLIFYPGEDLMVAVSQGAVMPSTEPR
jgi:hypothetical protein